MSAVENGPASELPEDFATHFELIADQVPDRPAVYAGDRVLTWSAFDEIAARLAGHLERRGIEAGDRVGLVARNSPEYLVALAGLLKLEATPVNVNYRYRAGEVRQVLDSARARGVVVDADLRGVVAEATAELSGCGVAITIDPEGGFGPEVAATPPYRRRRRGDSEWLLFTGGTTGHPKGVIGSQAERLRSVRSSNLAALGIDPDGGTAALFEALRRDPAGPDGMVQLPAPPLMHGTGLYMALGALAVGAPVVLLPPGPLTGAALLAAIERFRVTDLTIVGDAFALRLLDALDAAVVAGRPADIGSLRRIRSVGALWSAPAKRRLLAHADLTLIDRIAATEGGTYAVSTVTRATPDDQLASFRLDQGARLLDEQGRDVAPGEVGTLAAPVVATACYEGDPEATARAFLDIDGVRYSMPGDLARLGADGRLELLGRGSSVVNTGGEKVYTGEVESVLCDHPAVRDAVVVGVPDPEWGSVVAALVSLVPGVRTTPEELAGFVAARLAPHKKPRRVVLVDEVQRLATGKSDLTWARACLLAGDARSVPPR